MQRLARTMMGSRLRIAQRWSAAAALLAALAAWASATADGSGPAAQTPPQVRVDTTQHDFGKSDVGVGGQHAFVFHNTGQSPLVLTRGKSTCGCCTCVCTVRLPETAVPPGAAAAVTLEWQSKLFVGSFRQTATILTNDPDRPDVTLSLTGRFTGPVGVVPSQVSCGSLRVGQATTWAVHLYNYTPEAFDITSCEWSDPRTAECFSVDWEPLTAAQLREEGEARGGYLVRIAVRPGLPVGAFQQGLALKTTSRSVPRIDVPVQGTVVSDLSIAGQGWNAQAGVLTMGDIPRETGADWPLLVMVRGPHAKDIRLQLLRCTPDSLSVEMEPTQFIAAKELSLTRLKVRVRPGSPPSPHWGNERGEPGHISIQALPPVLPQVDIRVRFAVVE